jgi:hypothetical protein
MEEMIVKLPKGIEERMEILEILIVIYDNNRL